MLRQLLGVAHLVGLRDRDPLGAVSVRERLVGDARHLGDIGHLHLRVLLAELVPVGVEVSHPRVGRLLDRGLHLLLLRQNEDRLGRHVGRHLRRVALLVLDRLGVPRGAVGGRNRLPLGARQLGDLGHLRLRVLLAELVAVGVEEEDPRSRRVLRVVRVLHPLALGRLGRLLRLGRLGGEGVDDVEGHSGRLLRLAPPLLGRQQLLQVAQLDLPVLAGAGHVLRREPVLRREGARLAVGKVILCDGRRRRRLRLAVRDRRHRRAHRRSAPHLAPHRSLGPEDVHHLRQVQVKRLAHLCPVRHREAYDAHFG